MFVSLLHVLLFATVMRATIGNTEEDLLLKIKAAASSVASLNARISDDKQATLLIVAAREGYLTAMQQLLKLSGVDKDVQDVDGNSPLMAAIVGKHTDIATALVDSGCNVNLLNVEMKDSIMLAASSGMVPLLEMMIKKGAILTNKDQDGWTSLHHASANKQTSAVTALLKHADVNPHTRAKNGQTALHLSAIRGFVDVCRVLLLVSCQRIITHQQHANICHSLIIPHHPPHLPPYPSPLTPHSSSPIRIQIHPSTDTTIPASPPSSTPSATATQISSVPY